MNYFPNLMIISAIFSFWIIPKITSLEHQVSFTSNTKPYQIIWNSPIKRCGIKFGVDINITKYGIYQNTYTESGEYGDDWVGDKVALLANFNNFGNWPYLEPFRNGRPINHTGWPDQNALKNETVKLHNGGVPQEGNLTDHLRTLKMSVDRILPENFTGLGVFDMEYWRPIYKTLFSFKAYKEHSMNNTRSKHPGYREEALQSLAKVEFEIAAKEFMDQSVKFVQSLRPNAIFGYYGYPFCFKDSDAYECSDSTYEWNEQMQWLANSSSALFPSGYFYKQSSDSYKETKTHALLMATKKWRSRTNDVHKPIYLYTKIGIDYPAPFYTWLDLVNSIGKSADLGIDGALMWGNHYLESSEENCIQTKSYIDEIFGPFVKEVLSFTESCSRTLCNSHGRCALKDATRPSKSLRLISKKIRVLKTYYKSGLRNMREEQILFTNPGSYLTQLYTIDHNINHVKKNYRCECFRGYKGYYCQH